MKLVPAPPGKYTTDDQILDKIGEAWRKGLDLPQAECDRIRDVEFKRELCRYFFWLRTEHPEVGDSGGRLAIWAGIVLVVLGLVL